MRSELLGEQPQSLAAQAHIALLLPITGSAGPLAASVRDGFLSCVLPDAVQQRPVVRVYDTGGEQSVTDEIAAATESGADIIVGPLTRQAVAAAAADRIQRPPLLALNFLPDGQQAPPLFFQFALSPVEEARLVARRVLSDGHHLGLAIVPTGEWGTRVLAAFTQELQSGGGTLLASTMIDVTEADYSDRIKQVLGIDQSRARLDELESLLGTHLEFVPRRRDDIQFIFSPAPAAIERQLQPQLRFYYAGGLPAYATSDAFESDPRANQDLDGLMFPDMPWMLGGPLADAVRSAARQAWPAGGPARGRLFAFGFDAYRIAAALRENRAPSSLDLSGLTGQLTLDPDGHIHRQLTGHSFAAARSPRCRARRAAERAAGSSHGRRHAHLEAEKRDDVPSMPLPPFCRHRARTSSCATTAAAAVSSTSSPGSAGTSWSSWRSAPAQRMRMEARRRASTRGKRQRLIRAASRLLQETQGSRAAARSIRRHRRRRALRRRPADPLDQTRVLA